MKIFDSKDKSALLSILNGVREDLDRQLLEKDDLLFDHANMMVKFEGKDEEKYQEHKKLYKKIFREREDIYGKEKVIRNFIEGAGLNK